VIQRPLTTNAMEFNVLMIKNVTRRIVTIYPAVGRIHAAKTTTVHPLYSVTSADAMESHASTAHNVQLCLVRTANV
jgi:hypothetical protein